MTPAAFFIGFAPLSLTAGFVEVRAEHGLLLVALS
jgi:hypothetical protein